MTTTEMMMVETLKKMYETYITLTRFNTEYIPGTSFKKVKKEVDRCIDCIERELNYKYDYTDDDFIRIFKEVKEES